MKEIIDRACDIECATESDAKAVAALADLAVQLQSRLESLEKDAARYRWLRDNGRCNDWRVEQDKSGWITTHSVKTLDDAIDAAMKG